MASKIDMSKVDNLEQCLRFGANMYRFHSEALIDVDLYKSVAQAITSYEKERDSLISDVAKLNDELSALKEQRLSISNDISGLLDEAKKTAEDIISKAKAQANTEAQGILSRAVLDADKVRQEAFKLEKDAIDKVEALKADVADLENRAAAAKAAADAYKAALAGA